MKIFNKNKKAQPAKHQLEDAVKVEVVKLEISEPNDLVKQINSLQAELIKMKQQSCTHESRYKNGVIRFTPNPFSSYGVELDLFNECKHCGANIVPTGWKLADEGKK